MTMMADPSATTAAPTEPTLPERTLSQKQQKTTMLADEDTLLISHSITYVTDDGSVLLSFQSAPFSTSTSLATIQRQHW